MAINKNKVVTFNDLEQYAGVSTGAGTNLTIPSTWNLVTGLNSSWFKGFLVVDSSLKPNNYLKYLYYGYFPCADVIIESNVYVYIKFLYIGKTSNGESMNDTWVKSTPIYHIDNYNTTLYNNFTTSTISEKVTTSILPTIRALKSANLSVIQYSSIASLADEDSINDVWTSYHPIIDSSTGEPMKDEEGNILYEEGEYYAETRKIGDPISL